MTRTKKSICIERGCDLGEWKSGKRICGICGRILATISMTDDIITLLLTEKIMKWRQGAGQTGQSYWVDQNDNFIRACDWRPLFDLNQAWELFKATQHEDTHKCSLELNAYQGSDDIEVFARNEMMSIRTGEYPNYHTNPARAISYIAGQIMGVQEIDYGYRGDDGR